MNKEQARELRQGDYVWTRVDGKPCIVTVISFAWGGITFKTQDGQTMTKKIEEVELDPYYLFA